MQSRSGRANKAGSFSSSIFFLNSVSESKLKMKMNLLYSLFLTGSAFTSCSSADPVAENQPQTDTVLTAPERVYEKFETGKVISNVVCSNKPGFSFALYLPSTYTT